MVQWVTPFRRSDIRAFGPFQRELNDLFDSIFPNSRTPAAPAPSAISPAMDVDETPDAWLVSLEIPGLDPKDVQITVTGDTLVVRGESKREEAAADSTPYHRERHFGSFERTLTLPQNVESEKVAASYKNGVLGLTLPKRSESKPRSIQVEVK